MQDQVESKILFPEFKVRGSLRPTIISFLVYVVSYMGILLIGFLVSKIYMTSALLPLSYAFYFLFVPVRSLSLLLAGILILPYLGRVPSHRFSLLLIALLLIASAFLIPELEDQTFQLGGFFRTDYPLLVIGLLGSLLLVCPFKLNTILHGPRSSRTLFLIALGLSVAYAIYNWYLSKILLGTTISFGFLSIFSVISLILLIVTYSLAIAGLSITLRITKRNLSDVVS